MGRWPEWNPACAAARADGPITPGTQVDLTLRHPGSGREFLTRPKITRVDEREAFAWTSRGLGLHAEVETTFADDPEGTLVVLTAVSHGAMSFAYRLVVRPRTQAALYTMMLNGLSASFSQ